MAAKLPKRLRRLGLGLSTVLGLGARGFFIPYAQAAGIARPQPPNPVIEALFAARVPAFQGVLDGLDAYAADFAAIGGRPPPAPRWDQGWFPRLDAAVAYAMVRERRPRRIVEVGSGHSTRFLARAVADGGLATRITAIDPRPRRALTGLAVDHLACTAQQAPADAFAGLASGDILFIDSSHILMPGTDLDLLFGQVLARLPAGVLIHIHDIFLPDDYPPSWHWRGYNEQQAVAALLAAGAVRPLFAARYATTRLAGQVAASAAGPLPLPDGTFETSLWLEKTAGARTAP